MKCFCKDLKEHATKIFSYVKKNYTINKWRNCIANKNSVIYAKKNSVQAMKNTIHYKIFGVLLIVFVT